MDIAFYTGIRYHAYSTYGGHKFYTTGYDGTVSLTIGDGDSNVRVINNLYAPIVYDYNDTGYYVDPNGTSRIRKTNLIASGSGWDDGLNLYSSDATNRWNLLVDDGAADALRFAYNNSEALNINTSRNVTAAVDFRAPIFYDSNDTAYYGDFASTTRLSTLRVAGNDMFILGSSPTIHFVDSDERGCALHTNSNLFYILSSNGTGGESWATNNGEWPFYINLNNNAANFGGTITAAGSITSSSDIKLKENIETIDNSLDKVLKLRGVYYTLKRDESKTRKIGVIAQEIQEVLPEVVLLRKDVEDVEGTLAVDYGNITALLIEAIKEQQQQIEELREIINGQ